MSPQVNKYAKELLAAMSAGMEDKDDPGKHITLEAMSGLSKVLLYLDQKNVHLLVVYIFMKIKPFLENVRLANFIPFLGQDIPDFITSSTYIHIHTVYF